MVISTWNQLMAEVIVEIEPATIVAAIAASSVEHLGLIAGGTVKVITSTEVMIVR